MNLKKLAKIKVLLKQIQKSPSGRTFKELSAIAKSLGRTRVNRGKEPTFEKVDPPPFRPLTIPGHPTDVSQGVARSVAFQMLSDCDDWEAYLMLQEEKDEVV